MKSSEMIELNQHSQDNKRIKRLIRGRYRVAISIQYICNYIYNVCKAQREVLSPEIVI